MTLKDKMTADMSVFFNNDEFAYEWSYTPTGGVLKPVDVIPFKDGALQEPYVRGKEVAECFIFVQNSQVSNPQYRDIFNDGVYDWEFNPELGVTYLDNDMATIELRRDLT